MNNIVLKANIRKIEKSIKKKETSNLISENLNLLKKFSIFFKHKNKFLCQGKFTRCRIKDKPTYVMIVVRMITLHMVLLC